MAYDRNLYFNPNDKLKNLWQLAPNDGVLEYDQKIKTNYMYGELSSALPLFYLLTFMAIIFDIYLGVNVLAKYGLSWAFVIGSIIADIIMAVLVYLLAFKGLKKLNHTYQKNSWFKLELELMTKLKDETSEEYKNRHAHILKDLDIVTSNLNKIKYLRYFVVLVLFGVAIWKISNFASTLPPSVSVFSVTKGKIVITLALLTAFFHSVATEKTLASLMFNLRKNRELKKFRPKLEPTVSTIPVIYEGKYNPAKFKNTELVVNEKGEVIIKYIYVIWDDEIKYLMDQQTDKSARRGVAITCKQQQLS